MRARLLLVLALLLAACQMATGSGEVTEERLAVDPFTRVAVSHAFVVDVSVGDDVEVVLEVDDNLLDRVVVDSSGGALRIGLEPGFAVRAATLRAKVTTLELEELRASGASTVRVDGLLEAAELRTEASGASRIAARVDVERLDVQASGASTVSLTGTATDAALEASGASDLELEALETAHASAELSGASNAAVTALQELAADLSGASMLVYAGEPAIVRESLSGASRLVRSDDAGE